MGNAKRLPTIVLVVAALLIGTSSAHAQATVETGGASAGAGNDAATLAPNFSGMSHIITGTTAPASTGDSSATPADAQADTPGPDQPAASDASATDAAPGDSKPAPEQ